MYIDLTHTIEDGMPVFPGDDPVKLDQIKVYEKDGFNNHRLSTGMHVGTHLDGLMHMTADKRYISEFSLDSFAGKACVLNACGQSVISLKEEYREQVSGGDIVLVYTGFDKKFGQKDFFTDFPIMEEELAEFFVQKKIKMLGIDYASPDKAPYKVHNILFKNGILILENLTNLDKLIGEDFEVFAFPLKINADSSIVRAVARI
jgi:kynurenine formamidase